MWCGTCLVPPQQIHIRNIAHLPVIYLKNHAVLTQEAIKIDE